MAGKRLLRDRRDPPTQRQKIEGSVASACAPSTLPAGATWRQEQKIEEVFIPPPETKTVPQSSLIPIAALPAWARVCFPNVTHLNALQSRVYAAAFLSGKSMLVSAPTGAGKTNVAVLSILQQVFEHRFLQIAPRGRGRPRVSHRSAGRSGVDGGDEPSCVVEEPVCFELASETNRSAAAQDLHAPSLSCARGIHGLEGSNTEDASSSSASPPAPASASVCSDGRFSPPSARLFKVVYIAPMKSLVVEVVDKLAAALGKVGLVVKEMTGDVSLSPHEMQSVHVIVTVPEKWDILTRNARNSNFGADDSEAEERNLMTSVKCIIIDEIHLLDDERGPVLESIVARVLRHVEETQVHTRLIGISATLPNWQDVAAFLRVEPSRAFFFGADTRPIPLEQTLVGALESDAQRRRQKVNDVCYAKVVEAVKNGHQALVFVHSRRETVATAEFLVQAAQAQGHLGLFVSQASSSYALLASQAHKSRCREVASLFSNGVAIHHAGLLRSDRLLAEKLFRTGAVRVLCCTATLAWGVNLPARTVIIKGTSVYDSKSGGFRDISVLDVLQIFGRAGRPQYDTRGSAVLITEGHERLMRYVGQLTHSLPVESKFLENLENALNAEVATGTVSSVDEAVDWLRYTFCFVRMCRNPRVYGADETILMDDPELCALRRKLIVDAAETLHKHRLIRFNSRTQRLDPTNLGRMACRYYVDYETASLFRQDVELGVDEDRVILRLLGLAKEFASLKVRDDEESELSNLRRSTICRVPIVGDFDAPEAKVQTLVQAALAQAPIKAFSLCADSNYVQANIGRLCRALFVTSLSQGDASSAEKILEWTKAVERGLWPTSHVLRHFCNPNCFDPDVQKRRQPYVPRANEHPGKQNRLVLREGMVSRLEKHQFALGRLRDLGASEIASLVASKADGQDVALAIRMVPDLELDVNPITAAILRVSIALRFTEEFLWSAWWHGNGELFHLWVADVDTQRLLHTEEVTMQKENIREAREVSFALPLHEPTSTQFQVLVISDRWVGVSFQHLFSVRHCLLPDKRQAHTELLDLHPLPRTALNNPEFEALYNFLYFNPIQTQTFHVCYHTNYNVLLGAPTGNGKTIVAELAMLRLFATSPKQKIVYIAPLKALAAERLEDWKARFEGKLKKRVAEFTADAEAENARDFWKADIFVCTPEKWDGLSRQWRERRFVQQIGLVVIDEIHLLGQDRGKC
ncbi:putative activating signal cointegrator 1 complex subunit 3, partial [Toxoplasma gondii GAB2-2007-GAL-DOM2]